MSDQPIAEVTAFLGLHLDVPEAQYHDGPGVSASGLKRILRCPAYYREAAPYESPDLDTGSAFHCAALEPEHYDARFVTWQGRKQGKAWEAFKESNDNRTILTQTQHDLAWRMAEALHRHPFGGTLVGDDPGPVEASMYWTDEESRALCRCRPDKMSGLHDVVVDLKSAKDAAAGPFARQAANLRYDMSAALTARGYRAVMGKDLGAYIFAGVEKEPPHLVGLYTLGHEELHRGEMLIDRALELYARCLRQDDWPGLPNEIRPLEFPRWAFNIEVS